MVFISTLEYFIDKNKIYCKIVKINSELFQVCIGKFPWNMKSLKNPI